MLSHRSLPARPGLVLRMLRACVCSLVLSVSAPAGAAGLLDALTVCTAETDPVPAGPVPAGLAAGSERARAGSFVKIYDPGTGESEPWFFNDHTFIRDVDGTWHLFGITDEEPLIPPGMVEDSDQFGHATAPDLAGPWTRQPFALLTYNEGENCVADTCYRETHLWAPHVIFHDGLYYMFYSGGGSDRTRAEISLATSTDLFTWTRDPHGPLFRDGYEARDPMVLRVGDLWVMYYTATSTPECGNHVIAYRTSTDLRHWGERRIAFMDLQSGTDAGGTESPYVLQRGEWYYLFIGPRPYDIYLPPYYPGTEVFASRDPFRFDVSQQVGHLAAHAVEIVDDGSRLWASHAGWATGGVYLAPVDFDAAPVRGSSLYALSSGRDSVWRWSGSGQSWTRVGAAADRLVAGGYGLFSVQPLTGDLFRYNGTPGSWTRVSGPAQEFVVNAAGLYRRDSTGVSRWTGTDTIWTRIGGPARNLYAGGDDLFATNVLTGDIYHYNDAPMQWTRVGHGGRTWAANANGLYGLNAFGVFHWSGTGTTWIHVGGPAGSLYAGGATLHATDLLTGELNRYLNSPHSWEHAGPSARSFAACDDALYALREDGVHRQSGAVWSRIGGPAAAIVCGP